MSEEVRSRGWLPFMLAAVVLISLLGEGGDSPPVMLLVHGTVAAIWIILLVRPDAAGERKYGPATAPSISFAVFLAIAIAGATIAGYGYAAFMLLQELAVFTAITVLAARVGPGLCGYIAMPVLAAAGAQGLVILAQRFIMGQDRPAGTFLNTNHLGAWLVAALLVGLGTIAARRDRRSMIVASVLAAPVVAALVVSESRGAILGLAAGMALLTVLMWKQVPRGGRPVLLSALCLLAIIMTAVGVQRIRSVDPYSHHRLKIWRASAGMLIADPWLGTGPGQFASAAERYQFDDGTEPLRYDRVFSRPHSDWMRLPCEFGLPGAAALLLALVLAARAAGCAIRSGECGVAGRAAAAALAAIMVQGTVENLTERPAVYILAAVLIGSLLSGRVAGEERPGSGEHPRSVPLPRAIACVALVMLFIVGDLAPFAAWRLTERGSAGDRPPSYEVRLNAALRFNPLQPYLWMRHAEVLAGRGDRWDIGIYARARESAERAVRLHPRNGSLRLRLARIEGLACRTIFRDLESRTRAWSRYLEAEAISRPSALLALETGEFLYGTSEFNGALEAAGRAMALEPEAPAPRLLAARASMSLARMEEAGTFVAEAEALAVRHRDAPRENIYGRILLDLDAGQLRQVKDAMGSSL